MKELVLKGGLLQRNASSSLACVLGALVLSCATGTTIENEDVIFIPNTRPSSGELPGPESAEGAEPEGESAGDEALQPAGDMSGEDADEELPRADQPEDDDSSSQPEDDESGDESEPVPPVDVPIVDTESDVDDPDPDTDPDPIIQPDPVPDPPDNDPPSSGPTQPPVTNPVPVPDLEPEPVPTPLPAAGHCLAGWEGSSCDTCSGQTQSDRLSCRLYIDCYIVSDCDPASCGSVEQVCGVNRLGNGFAPKDIADSVYGCMCAP